MHLLPTQDHLVPGDKKIGTDNGHDASNKAQALGARANLRVSKSTVQKASLDVWAI